MKIKSSILLGASTNLINGYNPKWQPGSMSDAGLFATPNAPLDVKDIEIEPNEAGWKMPVIIF